MAKKRLKRIAKNNSRKKFPNPFNIFGGVNSAVKEISWSEKNLLIALFVFMFFVSLISDKGILSVTGSFTEVTGEQIADAGMAQAINDVFGVFLGIVSPILGLLGSKDLITIKLLLAVIIYMILVYSPIDIGRVMRGKGRIIAGMIALFVAAILPEQIIQTYILNLIPGFASLILALSLVFFFLWALHKYDAESSPGHLLKALLYFLVFIYIYGERTNIVSGSYLTGTPAALSKVAIYTLLAFMIYSFIKLIIELYDAAGKRQRRNYNFGGGGSHSSRSEMRGSSQGSRNDERKEREDLVGAEELAEKIANKLDSSKPENIKEAYGKYRGQVKSNFSSVPEKTVREIFLKALRNKGINT